MTDDDLAQPLLNRMGRLPVAELPPEQRTLRLGRMTQVVEDSLRRAVRARQRRRRTLWAGVTLAAAGAALFVSTRLPFGRADAALQSSLVRVNGDIQVRGPLGDHPVPGVAGMHLEPEVEIRTASASAAEVRLGSGAQVSIGPAARVRLPEDPAKAPAERIRLAGGRVALSVPKLLAGQTLSVVTSDTTVTVRGTRFSVDVSSLADGVVTSVAVEQGRVEVQSGERHAWLGAGDHWSSRAPSQATEPSVAVAAEPERAAPPASRSVQPRPSVKASSPEPEEQSSLAEENRLFEQALRKARGGSPRDALADLERFLRDHPRSPLIQSVRVEHFRLLREMGNNADAAREARRYLTDYPSGFARDDAKGIALFGVGGSP